MSSHHVVRDEQEPALLIMSSHHDHQLIDSLLEWSPTVIATTNNIDNLSEYGQKIDVVMGTYSSIEKSKSLLEYQEPINYITVEQERDILSKSLEFLKNKGHVAVNIIGEQFLDKEIFNSYKNELDIVLYEPTVRWYYISGVFKKWFSKGQRIHWPDTCEVLFNNQKIVDSKTLVTSDEGFLQVENEKGMWLCETI